MYDTSILLSIHPSMQPTILPCIFPTMYYECGCFFFLPTQTDQSNPHPARARSQLTSGGACSHRRSGSTNSPPPKSSTNVMHPECGQRQGGTTPTTLPKAAPALPRLKPELGTWHHAHFAAVPLMKCRGHTPTLRARAASGGPPPQASSATNNHI